MPLLPTQLKMDINFPVQLMLLVALLEGSSTLSGYDFAVEHP
jgi:hypothetical protein